MANHYECFVALLIRFREDNAVARRDRGAGRAVVYRFPREFYLLDAALRTEGREREGVWACFGRGQREAPGAEEAAQHLQALRLGQRKLLAASY